MCLKSRGSKNETHSYDAPVCSLSVLLLSTFFRIQYFSATTCQNKMNIMKHIMMKNARNMYSKKTSNNENHTNTVWQLPHTRSRTSHHYNSYVVYSCTPHTCTIVPLVHSTLRHCTPYIVPLFPVAPLHRTPAPYQFSKKNIAKKQKNIATFKDFAMFFCLFAMFFFLKIGTVQGCGAGVQRDNGCG